MVSEQLQRLCDIATQAHERVQANFTDINPIIGVNQRMRDSGFSADLMTIDCAKTGKRIVLLLHDAHSDTLSYQFSSKNSEPETDFQQMAFDAFTAHVLYDWIVDYFSSQATQR